MKISTSLLLAAMGVTALAGANGCCRDGTAHTPAASRGFADVALRARAFGPLGPAPLPAPVASESPVPELTKRSPVARTPRRAYAALRARSTEAETKPLAAERAAATLTGVESKAPPGRAPAPLQPGAMFAPPEPSPDLSYDPMVESVPPQAPAPAPVARHAQPSVVHRAAAPPSVLDEGPISDWHPSPGVAVASGIGIAGLALGGVAAGMDQPSVGLSAVSLGIGAAGFLTAGVIMLVEDSQRPVEVGVGPTSVAVRGAF